MASDAIDAVRGHVGQCIAEIQLRARRISPLDLHARMDEIRRLAAVHGLTALEGLARSSAQRALLPGHRVSMRVCLDHMDEALHSRSSKDCTAILAALALRLN